MFDLIISKVTLIYMCVCYFLWNSVPIIEQLFLVKEIIYLLEANWVK